MILSLNPLQYIRVTCHVILERHIFHLTLNWCRYLSYKCRNHTSNKFCTYLLQIDMWWLGMVIFSGQRDFYIYHKDICSYLMSKGSCEIIEYCDMLFAYAGNDLVTMPCAREGCWISILRKQRNHYCWYILMSSVIGPRRESISIVNIHFYIQETMKIKNKYCFIGL